MKRWLRLSRKKLTVCNNCLQPQVAWQEFITDFFDVIKYPPEGIVCRGNVLYFV